jgi:hypothetical protein
MDSNLNGAIYNPENNTSSYYIKGEIIASLDFNTDHFEDYADLSTEDYNGVYSDMTDVKKEYEYQVSQILVESDYK